MACQDERVRRLTAGACAWCEAEVPAGRVVRSYTVREHGQLPRQGTICAPCDWQGGTRAGAVVTARDVAEYRGERGGA